MKKLNIENFLNEMSYDLRMEELNRAVNKYQETLIEYFISSQFTYKEKKRFHEVCEVVRSKKFMVTLNKLIHEEVVMPDMAYVVVTATDFPFVDKEIKGNAAEIAYKLRYEEISERKCSDEMRSMLASLTMWTVTEYNVSPYFRTKCAEKVIKRMPGVLANVFREYDPKVFTSKKLFFIFSQVIADITPKDLITAFFKSDFDYKPKDRYFGHATVLRKFVYELCRMVDHKMLADALSGACESMKRFNQRHGRKESFHNKYMNFELIRCLALDSSVNTIESSTIQNIKYLYDVMKRFTLNNPEYKSLF